MRHVLSGFSRTGVIVSLCLSLGACGAFHPEPYAMFADHPDYDVATAAIVSISALEEDEYTIIGDWTRVRIARKGDDSWRRSEGSWWVALAPGNYLISIPAPGSHTSIAIEGNVVDGQVRADQVHVTRQVILEIPVRVEAGKKYRLVQTSGPGGSTYELREMEYIGDLWNWPH